jgi:hypothetical protein
MAKHNRDAAAKRSGQHSNGTGVQFIFSLFIIHLPASAISPAYRPAAIGLQANIHAVSRPVALRSERAPTPPAKRAHSVCH